MGGPLRRKVIAGFDKWTKVDEWNQWNSSYCTSRSLQQSHHMLVKKKFLWEWRMEVSENVRLTVMNGYWHLGHKGSTFVEDWRAGETKNATQKNGTKAAHNEIRAATTTSPTISSLLLLEILFLFFVDFSLYHQQNQNSSNWITASPKWMNGFKSCYHCARKKGVWMVLTRI